MKTVGRSLSTYPRRDCPGVTDEETDRGRSWRQNPWVRGKVSAIRDRESPVLGQRGVGWEDRRVWRRERKDMGDDCSGID